MLPVFKHPLYNFHYKPNFKYGLVYCEYELKSTDSVSKSWPYIHDIINQKILKLRGPYIWFKNKKNKNIIYNLKLFNYNLKTYSEWHLGARSSYDIAYWKFKNDDNIFYTLLQLLFALLSTLIWGINIIIFKIYKFYKRNNSGDDEKTYGFHFIKNDITENKLDKKGRTVYVKSIKKSYTSFDKVVCSNITYDTQNSIYIEELTITYIKYEGWFGEVPTSEKMKLVVYPYYESDNKPVWYNNLNDDWQNCLIFESSTEDRLKYIITKPNDKIF